MNKYNAQKFTVYGITFDSRKEGHRYLMLLDMQQRGKISNLQMQVKYELIPSQYIDGKCVERAVNYVADFVYLQDGQTVVEDVKGYRDPKGGAYAKFVIKRKLMLHRYGIRVKEI